MLEDPCPNCGHRRKPMMMSTRHDASLSEMWNGEGEWWQASLLKAAALIAVFMVLAFAVIPYM